MLLIIIYIFFIHALLTETSTEKNDVGNDFLENKNISFVFFMKSEWFVWKNLPSSGLETWKSAIT